MEAKVTIILTELDAEQFKLFQKYYDVFKAIDNTKALDIGFGKCILNFAFGELQNVVKEEVVYKR